MPTTAPPSAAAAATAPPADRHGRRAWALALLFVAAVEGLVAAFVPALAPIERGERFYPAWRQPTLEESLMHWQVLRVAAIDEAPDVLVLGDSTALMGVDPATLEAQSGLTAQNLGLFGLVSTHGVADMYAWYLRFVAPPDIVVLHVGAFAFLLTDREVEEIEMLAAMRRWMGTHESALTWWPSWRLRGGGTAAPVYDEALLRAPRGPVPSDAETRERLVRTRGYFEEPRRTEDWRSVIATPPTVRDDAVRGLRPLLEATARTGTPVVVVRAPLPEIFRWPAYEALVEASHAALDVAFAEWDHVTLASPWVRWMPVENFATFEHPTREGAVRNSHEVARMLVEALAASGDGS